MLKFKRTQLLGGAAYVLLFWAANAVAGDWLKFEPEKVTLTGSVVSQNSTNEKQSTYYVLQLDNNINVQGDPSDPINSESIEGVSKVQLIDVSGKLSIAPLQGKHVRAIGSFSTAVSAGHHTNPILIIDQINSAP